MSRELEYQERISIEFMEYSLCKECQFYKYSDRHQICLFNSGPLDQCNIINLLDQEVIKKSRD